MLAHMKWRTKVRLCRRRGHRPVSHLRAQNEARVESDVATALERQKARIEEHLRKVAAQCGDASQQAEDAQLRLIQLGEVADAARSERARKRSELRVRPRAAAAPRLSLLSEIRRARGAGGVGVSARAEQADVGAREPEERPLFDDPGGAPRAATTPARGPRGNCAAPGG